MANNKLVNKFAESALASIKTSLREANEMLQSFSLTDVGKACDEAQKRIVDEFNRFKKQIKGFIDKHTVEVPFNNKTDKLSYEVVENLFTVHVTSKDNSHTSTHAFELPDEIDTSDMAQSFDSERKVMIFKFGKK